MDLPNPILVKVTERVIARSQKTRAAYLQRIEDAQGKFPARGALSCANLAHGFAKHGRFRKTHY